MFDVRGASLTTLANLIATGQHTSVEITEAYLARIEKYNPKLNAYLKVFKEESRADAVKADAEIESGKHRGPLHGIPIALKDIIDVAGHSTTAGGILLGDEPKQADAEVVTRLREAGAVILGKLNLHEYAWGGTTDNPHYGRCYNPWKEGYSPGGSSGGSGAAVVADLCAAALGTDTLGSVRIPSSYCGCVGIKPTAGRVSNRGVYPLSWSLDNVGPLTRRVQDATHVFNALASHDPQDPYSAPQPFESIDLEDKPSLKGLRIGVPSRWIGTGKDSAEEEAVVRAFFEAVDVLVALGAERVEIESDELAEASGVAIQITLADAAAIHQEHLAKNADKIGSDVRRLLEVGASLPGTSVAEMHHAARRIRMAVAEVINGVDCIVSPTTPGPAHDFDASATGSLAKFTATYNLLGYPAVSVPCGFTDEDLPISLMIGTKPFDETTALKIAQAYESATSWTETLPSGFE